MLILEERGIPRSKPNGVSVCGEVCHVLPFAKQGRNEEITLCPALRFRTYAVLSVCVNIAKEHHKDIIMTQVSFAKIRIL